MVGRGESGGRMWDALIVAVATALASQAAGGIGGAAWAALSGKVRRRLGPKAELVGAGDREALEQALQQVVQDDPAFAARMQSLVLQAREQRGEGGHGDLVVPSPALLVRTVPRQLPAGTSDFVNQVGALSALDEIGGGAGATPVVVLRGAPGVGKSALALRWGHKRQDWFGGGQFYADLREAPEGVLGGAELADDALTSFLVAMGVPNRLLPDSFAARQSLFRTLSAEKPVLVVLHGATLPAQIRPLVPTAPGSVVLVSTQHDVGGLVVDGARFIDVEPLDEEAALSLLAAVCGDDERIEADRAAAKRLVNLCGRLPVAVRVIAGRLHLDPTMTVADLAEEVAEEPYLLDAMTLPGGSGAVEPLFTSVYRHLRADAQRLYRDIGALPVLEVSDDLLARAGWPDREVRQAAVDGLLGMRLLERLGRDRYAQHPLIRSHAARLAHELAPGHAERVVAGSIEYFCDFAVFANQAIIGSRRWVTEQPAERANPFAGDGARAAALHALEQSRADLLRVARVAMVSGAYRQVVRLAEAATALYFNHRHLADWIEMSRLAIAAAQRLGRQDVEAQARCTLSRAYADDGKLEAARVEIEAAVALLPQVNDPILAGTVWEFYGRYLDLAARAAPVADQPAARDRAEAAFHRAIDVYVENGERRGAALGRLFLGAFLDTTGRPAEALPHLELARQGLNDVDDDRNSARADAAIGAAHLHLGHYRQAYDGLSAAAAYMALAELWHYEAEVRENLALAATVLGERAAAAEHSQRAAEIRRLSEAGQ